jgi:hypothetical protein
VFGPPGALIGAVHANVTRPEVWEALPITALAPAGQGGVLASAISPDASTPPVRAVKRGRGRQIAIGAALGTAAGAAYASSNKSATPTGTKMVMFAIPAGLLGAAVGAFIP